jgi:hypothetical protein
MNRAASEYGYPELVVDNLLCSAQCHGLVARS